MNRRGRGFTLLELMLTVALGSVVGSAIFSVVYMQTLTFLERLDDADARQNGRAALAVLRGSLQRARYGMGTDPDAIGLTAIGQCASTIGSLTPKGACNNLVSDGGADRLRVVSIVADANFLGNAPYASANTCDTYTFDSAATLHYNKTGRRLPTGSPPVIIGGSCSSVSDPPAANDLLILTGDSPGAACAHRYAYKQQIGGAAVLSCPLGYEPAFGLGTALVEDYFIDNLADGTPALVAAGTATAQNGVVAANVEDLQVLYGIDLTDPPDAKVDVWCADPRSAAEFSGACSATPQPGGGTPYTSMQMYNRIVAVQLAVRVRTDKKRNNRKQPTLNPQWTADNPIANPADGYVRSILSTTVALRNSFNP